MQLKVISFSERDAFCVCFDDSGRKHRIDLEASGQLPQGMRQADLVGKVVEVRELDPYVTIAHGVIVLEEVRAA